MAQYWGEQVAASQDASPRRVDEGTVEPSNPTTPTCNADEQEHGGHCYWRVTGIDMSRAAASTKCTQQNGGIVTIESEAEDAFVYGLLASTTTGVWIGLERAGGTWRWVGGAAVSYTNWAPGEPNNEDGNEDCGVLWGPALKYPEMRAKWNDAPCDVPGRDTVVCERVP